MNIIETMKNLDGFIYWGKASKKLIAEAELGLSLAFSSEYREYVENLGALYANKIVLTGILDDEERNVVSVTKREWELNPQVPHDLYVIENGGIDGIIIWQDSNGFIYQTKPFQEPVKIFTSLNDYVIGIK